MNKRKTNLCSICARMIDKNEFIQHFEGHMPALEQCFADIASVTTFEEFLRQVQRAFADQLPSEQQERVAKEIWTNVLAPDLRIEPALLTGCLASGMRACTSSILPSRPDFWTRNWLAT